MKTTDVIIESLGQGEGYNWTFNLIIPGFAGKFRISYSRKSKSNARYPIYRATDVYLLKTMNNNDYKVEHCVDACLFIERNKQWILEKLIREND